MTSNLTSPVAVVDDAPDPSPATLSGPVIARDAPGQTTVVLGAVTINSPAADAFVSPTGLITGTASLTLESTDNETGEVTDLDITKDITSVIVQAPGFGPVDAVHTGPADRPWLTWSFVLPGVPAGALDVHAQVSPKTTRFGTSANRRFIVDAAPPALTINPPADVLTAAPPFIATVTGTASDAGSGVAGVTWQFPGGPLHAATGTTNWSAQVELPGLGEHPVTFQAADLVGNVSPAQNVSVRVGDVTGPSLGITTPTDGETHPLVDGLATFPLRGTASDTQTGVSSVEWALDGSTDFTPATAEVADWSLWSAQVPIGVAGSHTIVVRALDRATPANPTNAQVGVVVAERFEPADPDAVFSPAAYLDDLLSFATHRTTVTEAGPFITRQLLVDTYRQPFTDLVTPENRAVANQPVSQVRLCIDVLRRYLAAHSGSVSVEAEAAYRQAAYAALLRQLGTSYEELRLARAAEGSARSALADRLGIALSRVRPDRLDQLLFEPANLTEAALESIFGVEKTAIKPLIASLLAEPTLLTWQKEQLRVGWHRQDDAALTDLGSPVPLIDPDLVGVADLRSPNPGDPAFDLRKARHDDLETFAAQLDQQRKGQRNQQAGFDKIVATVAPVADLLALAEQRGQGLSIDEPLRAKHLTLPAFGRLMRVRALAATGTVLDSEWADVYAILVQVRKVGRAVTWRAEEVRRGLVLGPDAFVLSDPADAPAPVTWRSTPQARQAWRRTLESRIQQDLALTLALQAAVSAAEEEALPLLREACVAAIAGDRTPAVIADRLTGELGIDCSDRGHHRTTRAFQALETLQVVLLSLRTGRLKSEPPVLGTANPAAGWTLAFKTGTYEEKDFDAEWLWMGGYGTWNAAIRVFAYPESYLAPELRPAGDQTQAFADLMTALQNQPRLTPPQARDIADAYHHQLSAELGPRLPATLAPGVLTITDQVTDPELAVRKTSVRELFGTLTDPSKVSNFVQEIFYAVPLALAVQLQRSGEYLAALDWIETFYTDHLAAGARKIYHGLVLEETIETRYERNPDNWLRVGLNPHEIATVRGNAHTRFTLMTLARCYLDFADAEFTRDEPESIARARALYQSALSLLTLPDMVPPGTGAGASPFPPNPVPQALRSRGELNLFKLRSGRNIAGIERQAAPLTTADRPQDRLPVAGAQRQFRPTPYRYAVLVERAKNLVSIAQQVEQAFLAALEKRDAETYNLLKAGHDLRLAGATVDLHGLQVKEAEQGIGLAERQLDRAATQRDTYQGWIDAGLNTWEITIVASHVTAGIARALASEADAALVSAQAVATASAGGFLGTGLSAALGPATAAIVAARIKEGAQLVQIAAETTAQIAATNASFERRSQEWQLQRQLAEGDMAIGAQQVSLAQTHTEVARQEELVSRVQLDEAQATVEFLAHKFTNAELYAWMSGVLGGAYTYFLQQATATAQLAQSQLAFERQESPPAFIKADYWEDTHDQARAAGAPTGPDRQGLTGSVRLLTDITRLDQFAFDTVKRKLQLAQTFSLARLAPTEFQRFRDTGVLPFATPMAVFDQGFPGHYLRLVKRVRVSVVALVPPDRGLRATLIASGISRVVTGGDVFSTVTVRRDPELIAFTGTSNATGLLELEPDQGLLLPFESMGVDTQWELQLPKAANPFDFGSIADVLFTVEYTALSDASYRQQVIQQLDDRVSAERAISVRDQFPDQWYALHNPVADDAPLVVEFTLRADQFPPNVSALAIEQLLLAVVRAEGTAAFELGPTQLTLTTPGAPVAVGGEVAGTVDGLISTRRGNATAWLPLIGATPTGVWRLTLPGDLRERLAREEVEDLLLVLTYEGRTPPWPV